MSNASLGLTSSLVNSLTVGAEKINNAFSASTTIEEGIVPTSTTKVLDIIPENVETGLLVISVVFNGSLNPLTAVPFRMVVTLLDGNNDPIFDQQVYQYQGLTDSNFVGNVTSTFYIPINNCKVQVDAYPAIEEQEGDFTWETFSYNAYIITYTTVE